MGESEVKIYISSLSGNKEVKKRQQRVQMILESKHIQYSLVDITEPTNDKEKDFMQANATAKGETVSDADPRKPLPPQIFNGETYCGDYNGFELANECDTLENFLHLPESTNGTSAVVGNGKSVAQPSSMEEPSEEVAVEEPAVEKTEVLVEAETNGDVKTTEETPLVAETAGDTAAADADTGNDAGRDSSAGAD